MCFVFLLEPIGNPQSCSRAMPSSAKNMHHPTLNVTMLHIAMAQDHVMLPAIIPCQLPRVSHPVVHRCIIIHLHIHHMPCDAAPPAPITLFIQPAMHVLLAVSIIEYPHAGTRRTEQQEQLNWIQISLLGPNMCTQLKADH